MDLVSICIPAYKPGHFRECITSALAQTYKNMEILVSDDCPDGAIEAICADYSSLLTYVRNTNPGGKGMNNAFNLCRLARGRYIKFLFDDDMLHPFCVQYLVEALEKGAASGAAFSFSPRGIISESNSYIGTINMFNVTALSVLPGSLLVGFIASTLLNPVGELTTVLFKREHLLDGEGRLSFMEIDGKQLRALVDVAAWLNMGQIGPAVIHPFVLSYFRSHPNQNSNAAYNDDFIYAFTEWEDVIAFCRRRGLLSGAPLRQAYEKLVQRYTESLATLPQLQPAIERIRDECMSLC